METPPDSSQQLSNVKELVNRCIFLAAAEGSNICLLNQMRAQVGHFLSSGGDTGLVTLAFGNAHSKGSAPCLSIKEHFLRLFRRHALHKNERETVLNTDDQLIAIQLCLASRNKKTLGDYDTEASQVLQTQRCLTAHKLQPLASLLPAKATQPSQTDNFADFLVEYEKFLKDNNVTDWMDVCGRLVEEAEKNEELRKALVEKQFLLLDMPTDEIEKHLLSFLAKDRTVYTVRAEVPLDQSFTEQSPHPSSVVADIAIQEGALNDVLQQSQTMATPANVKSVTETYIEKILLDYLQLLINSRNEVSLARVINVPHRGLGHTAFTHLKHEADRKGVSMYQTAVSYIMRLRLGGRSYAPDPNSKLTRHVKGLGEFTDLMQKLQTILEEDTDIRSAVRRPMNILKNTILKCGENLIRPHSVAAVTERLQNQAEQVIDQMEQTPEDSPQRSASLGGSLVGRRAMRVLRSILDHWSAQPSSARHSMDILSDAFSSQGTPLRFPCLMTKFRSPLECSPDAFEAKSLAQRMKKKQKAKTKAVAVPRYEATHDWAKPVHSVDADHARMDMPVIEDFVPSKSLVHPGSNLNSKQDSACWSRPLARRVLESVNDQENVSRSSQAPALMPTDCKKTTSLSKEATKQKKRPLSQLDTNCISSQPPNAKKAKRTQSKAGNKKHVPLQKGQKQLTAFFRV